MNDRIAYSSRFGAEAPSSDLIAVHCCDHRFQNGFRDFLSEGLKSDSYALLAILGGPHVFTMENVMPKFTKAALQSLTFIIKRANPKRAALIGHDDCLFFKERMQFFFNEESMKLKQFANLKRAKAALAERFPSLQIDAYYADRNQNGSIDFLLL